MPGHPSKHSRRKAKTSADTDHQSWRPTELIRGGNRIYSVHETVASGAKIADLTIRVRGARPHRTKPRVCPPFPDQRGSAPGRSPNSLRERFSPIVRIRKRHCAARGHITQSPAAHCQTLRQLCDRPNLLGRLGHTSQPKTVLKGMARSSAITRDISEMERTGSTCVTMTSIRF